MKLLLDTHVWLWMLSDSPRLGTRTRKMLSESHASLFVSAISFAEVSIKQSRGKLSLPCTLERLAQLGRFESLNLDVAAALQLANLPAIHKDPFDRMLIAQAQSQGMTLVTADQIVSSYSVSTQDASL